VPLQIKFLELSGTEKNALYESKAKVLLSQYCVWNIFAQSLEAPAAVGPARGIAATGPGLVLIFLI
jgi:hypothetical protein